MPREADGPSVRVLVVDDHPLIRLLVRAACARSPLLEVVGEAANGEQALAECVRRAPDVIVLDVNLPRLDGLAVARRLRAEQREVRILLLTGRDEGGDLLDAMRIGVDGFLDKGASAERIADAIERVARGGRVFTPEQEVSAARELGDRARQAQEAVRTLSTLTPRQRSILPLIAGGLTARQIGAKLGISERSVRSHLSALYRKLGVRGRVEVVSRAVNLGLLPERQEPGRT